MRLHADLARPRRSQVYFLDVELAERLESHDCLHQGTLLQGRIVWEGDRSGEVHRARASLGYWLTNASEQASRGAFSEPLTISVHPLTFSGHDPYARAPSLDL